MNHTNIQAVIPLCCIALFAMTLCLGCQESREAVAERMLRQQIEDKTNNHIPHPIGWTHDLDALRSATPKSLLEDIPGEVFVHKTWRMRGMLGVCWLTAFPKAIGVQFTNESTGYSRTFLFDDEMYWMLEDNAIHGKCVSLFVVMAGDDMESTEWELLCENAASGTLLARLVLLPEDKPSSKRSVARHRLSPAVTVVFRE